MITTKNKKKNIANIKSKVNQFAGSKTKSRSKNRLSKNLIKKKFNTKKKKLKGGSIILKCPRTNGLYRKGTLSPHHHFEINSKKLLNFQKKELDLLSLFHTFAIKNDIHYSIWAGNLLGYYRNKDMIPWDDDIDILVNTNCYDKIHNLWLEGTSGPKWDNNWDIKHTQNSFLKENKFLIAKSLQYQFFKILNMWCKGQKDLSGIDIYFSETTAPKMTKHLDNKKLLTVKIRHITTKSLPENLAVKELERIYGTKWKLNMHPSLHNEIN